MKGMVYMNNEKMTVHEALRTLKMLDKRIETAIEAPFVMTYKASATKIGSETLEQVKTKFKANYQSAMDLIRRRVAIKNAVVLSNAGAISVKEIYT